MCSVFLPEEDRVVTIMCDHLDPVVPQRGDAFKVCLLVLFIFERLTTRLSLGDNWG